MARDLVQTPRRWQSPRIKETFYKIFGIVFVVGFLALATTPVNICRPGRKQKERTEAISYAKQLFLALSDFESRYGSFPSEETMTKLAAEKGIKPFPLVNSNDYFCQLVAGGLSSEKIGYCAHPSLPTHRPDNVISPLEQAFAKGECGFAYIAGLSSTDPPDTPILLAPMIPGTRQFDQKAFDGKAIVVRLDGSATTEQIRIDNGLVSIRGGRTLFDADAPHWHGKMPDVKYPAR